MERGIRDDKIEIKKPSPGIQVLEMEQPIAHRSPHQGQRTWSSSLEELGPKGGGNTREIQDAWAKIRCIIGAGSPWTSGPG
jgi:hypothetical protein